MSLKKLVEDFEAMIAARDKEIERLKAENTRWEKEYRKLADDARDIANELRNDNRDIKAELTECKSTIERFHGIIKDKDKRLEAAKQRTEAYRLASIRMCCSTPNDECAADIDNEARKILSAQRKRK